MQDLRDEAVGRGLEKVDVLEEEWPTVERLVLRNKNAIQQRRPVVGEVEDLSNYLWGKRPSQCPSAHSHGPIHGLIRMNDQDVRNARCFNPDLKPRDVLSNSAKAVGTAVRA